MDLDDRQIKAKLKVARGLLREVRNSFQGSSLLYSRCFNLVNELDNLIESFVTNE